MQTNKTLTCLNQLSTIVQIKSINAGLRQQNACISSVGVRKYGGKAESNESKLGRIRWFPSPGSAHHLVIFQRANAVSAFAALPANDCNLHRWRTDNNETSQSACVHSVMGTSQRVLLLACGYCEQIICNNVIHTLYNNTYKEFYNFFN